MKQFHITQEDEGKFQINIDEGEEDNIKDDTDSNTDNDEEEDMYISVKKKKKNDIQKFSEWLWL